MKWILFFTIQFLTICLFSQTADTIHLLLCYEEAEKNYPLYAQKEIFTQSSSLQLKNIKTSSNPQLNITGQASYQNEVTALDNIPNMDIPSAPLDQYKIALDFQQNIYDGGLLKKQTMLEKAGADTRLQQVEVDLYQLKLQVNGYYFNALLLQESLKHLKNLLKDLLLKEKIIISGVKNGILLQSDHDELRAEILKTEQTIFELENNKSAALIALAKLIGRSLDDSVQLSVPTFDLPSIESPHRPENLLFAFQVQQLEASKGLLNAKRQPRVYAFGQAGYGRPGFNMLSDEFSPFYIIGVGMKWNIWDWGTASREKQVLDFNQAIVKSNEDAFNTQLSITLEQQAATIESLVEALNKYLEIIKLRENIQKTASSQLENGTITTTDYLHKLNAELIARIEYTRHTIMLEQTKANFLILKGEL